MGKELVYRINDQIIAKEVRLVDLNNLSTVMSITDAQKKADEEGLDLIEIVPASETSLPICKILDYDKFRFSEKKKMDLARKNQKVIETKEIKFHPAISNNDYNTKIRTIKRILDEGDNVKVTVFFNGREITHKEIGFVLTDRIKNDICEYAKIESDAKLRGKNISMIISALKINPTQQPIVQEQRI